MKLAFNTESMIKPSKPEHFLALLKEASAELDNLHEYFCAVVAACEKSKQTA
jgi:hypothetical protein